MTSVRRACLHGISESLGSLHLNSRKALSLHQDADYPAIVPLERSRALLGRELTSEENCVRGTLVSGLTAEDIAILDVFEGNVRTSEFPPSRLSFLWV